MGRRRLFFAGLLVFCLGSACCGLAPSAPALIAARALQAAGAALLGPSSLALLLDAFPLAMRTTVVGLYGAMAAFAVALGPSLGSVIVQTAGWRWAFLINVPIGLAAWLAGRRVLRESRDRQVSGRPDGLGVALLIVALGALALGIVQGNDWGWRDPRVLAAFALALLGVPLCIQRARVHPVPMLDLDLFRARSFALANLATVLFTAAFFAGLLANVLYLTSVWRYSLIQAGLALTPAPVCATCAGIAAARLAARYGHRAVIVPGTLIFAIGLLVLTRSLTAEPAFLEHWLLPNVLLGSGVGLALPTLSSAVAASLPPARLAMGSAVFSTVRQFGAVLGTPAPSALIAAFGHAYEFCLLMALASGVVSAALGRAGGPAVAAESFQQGRLSLAPGESVPQSEGRQAS